MDRKLDQKQNLPRIYSPVTFKTVYLTRFSRLKQIILQRGNFRVGGGGFSRSFSGPSKIGRLLNKYV